MQALGHGLPLLKAAFSLKGNDIARNRHAGNELQFSIFRV